MASVTEHLREAAATVTVFAHAGHWAVQLLYLAPLVVLVWMLVSARLRDRGQRDSSVDSSD